MLNEQETSALLLSGGQSRCLRTLFCRQKKPAITIFIVNGSMPSPVERMPQKQSSFEIAQRFSQVWVVLHKPLAGEQLHSLIN
ncbi:hypothetical protein QWA_02050 [Alcaligenes faecalis subsp. faecalis NCIB 8687]|nr:hypothetical protein QWA_02050 [Alcaligenes faecalis subsp. faecalis NCIB 8687]ERI34268.1 hypothetical protein N879_01770 [Alcaligenes sp. EGD-AK7]